MTSRNKNIFAADPQPQDQARFGTQQQGFQQQFMQQQYQQQYQQYGNGYQNQGQYQQGYQQNQQTGPQQQTQGQGTYYQGTQNVGTQQQYTQNQGTYEQQQYGQNQNTYQHGNTYEHRDYNDPSYIPDKLDLNFYGLQTDQRKIQCIAMYQLQNEFELFSVCKQNKSQSMFEALFILKSLNQQRGIIHAKDCLRIQASLGIWYVMMNDLDRIVLILTNLDYPSLLARKLLLDILEQVEDEKTMKQKSGVAVYEQILTEVEQLMQRYENLDQTPEEKKMKMIVDNKAFVELDAYYQKGPAGLVNITRIECVSFQEEEKKQDAFSAQNIIDQLKQTSCDSLGPCFCILVFFGICFLIYWFVIRLMLSTPTSSPASPPIGHQKHIFLPTYF